MLQPPIHEALVGAGFGASLADVFLKVLKALKVGG